MKTSELTGAALDWAVSVCEHNVGWEPEGEDRDYYSTDWSQGGPIIEREKLTVAPYQDGGWLCTHPTDRWHGNKSGPTPLIAAMRCYVASKLGDEVDIPKELL